MTSFTVYLHERRPLVLVAERYSLGAALFGPLWLLAHAAWIPAVLLGCAWVAAIVLVPPALLPPVVLGLGWFAGLAGRDMRCWSLARRGWRQAHVVVAANEEEALARLWHFHPALSAADLPRARVPA